MIRQWLLVLKSTIAIRVAEPIRLDSKMDTPQMFVTAAGPPFKRLFANVASSILGKSVFSKSFFSNSFFFSLNSQNVISVFSYIWLIGQCSSFSGQTFFCGAPAIFIQYDCPIISTVLAMLHYAKKLSVVLSRIENTCRFLMLAAL